ncbi:uncharacterized protein TNCV_1089731 [Trichonephila clavipes]|uniref:Reverse transcriptase domain-containing protein n=1 Tax=Trichonephila clavipes TaxID=2585209 RepID=A0A8X6VFZ5_TRICX|nr:uncharacterized protein TNCV_1089731 [Trichonephila clavipes]
MVRSAEPENKIFKNCRKEDLRIVALELGETVAEKVTIVELTEIIKENKYFKEDVEFVKELIQYTIEDRKRVEEDLKKEAENRLREKELELELARLNVRVNADNERTATRGLLATDHVILNHGQVTWTTPELAPPLLTTTPHQREDVSALDRFNVHRCPTRWVFSGTGLEPVTKQATVRYQYHSATAATTRHPNETYIQYTSRLITNWQYYLKLRKVSDFDNLNDLIVSDKIFSSLKKEVASHISIRAGNDWFSPLELAKEIDLYNTSRGKSLKPLPNVLTRNNPVKNASRAADNLELTIKKFWKIENVEIDSVKTSELDICEDHFKNTHSRNDQGRYMVAMPLKEDPSCLGESRQTGIQRLNSLWKRLGGDKEYLSLYEKFLQEYEDFGHMREIKEDGFGVSFYMPHHGVYHPEKSTTKLITVFNASSPSTSGKSLNSIQFNGGLVQEDLFSIMVRFRKHKYAFTTDIEKMFRMINIHPEQTCLQRILWKKGIGEPIKTYELTTVTYGTVSALYLATRTLKQLAMDEANNFPSAAPVVMSDCYMDDILSGSDSIEEVIELQHQLIEMFKTAGMHLHKWCGNLPEITSNQQEYAFLESDVTKALGIIWLID